MNVKLNLWPGLTLNEWESLENIMSSKYPGKSLNHLLYVEINKKFSSPSPLTCNEIKFKKIIKHFELDFDADIVRAITCRSYVLGISPVELISRVILFPLLNPLGAEVPESI